MIYAFNFLDSYVIAVERTTVPFATLALLALLTSIPFFANVQQPEPSW